jgi:hypothetical protein
MLKVINASRSIWIGWFARDVSNAATSTTVTDHSSWNSQPFMVTTPMRQL